MKRILILSLAGLGLLTSGLSAQSLLGTQGLGYPLEPLDARTRALGGVGIGLPATAVLPTDPAVAAFIPFPSLEMTLQPQWTTETLNGRSRSTQGTRFPLIGLAYPVFALKGAVTASVGGFMDQRWEAEEPGTAEIWGTTLPVTDRLESDGGVSSFRIGWAQRLGDKLAIAAGVGVHAGSVTRTFTRVLDSVPSGIQVVPYTSSRRWQYSGLTASGGFRWEPSLFFRAGGSVIWSSDLKARPEGDSEGDRASYPLPTEVRLGATGILTSDLALTLGVSYADWKSSSDGLESATVVGTVWSYGGGVEWAGWGLGSRVFPLRVGFRRADLPFTYAGAAPRETTFSGGIGLNLTRPEDVIVGTVDLAMERGHRDAGALSESFWRGTVTFRVGSW